MQRNDQIEYATGCLIGLMIAMVILLLIGGWNELIVVVMVLDAAVMLCWLPYKNGKSIYARFLEKFGL